MGSSGSNAPHTATTAAGVAGGVLAALGLAGLWIWWRGLGEVEIEELELDELEVEELEVEELKVGELKVDRLVVRELVVEQRTGASEGAGSDRQ